MFDSVLDKGSTARSAFGRGAVVSVAVHLALVLFAVWFSGRPAAKDELVQEVTFFAALPPPPPPPPPLGSSSPKLEKKLEPKKKPIKKPDVFVQPIELPTEVPLPEPEPAPEEAAPEPEQSAVPAQLGGQKDGVSGGVPGGVVLGVSGGKLGGTGTEVLPFGEGMTRPIRLSGAEVQYTREARAARVEGLVLVKCTITVDGSLANCRIVRSLPYMDASILEAVKSWRYSPVTYQGRPINVDYVIPLRLSLR